MTKLGARKASEIVTWRLLQACRAAGFGPRIVAETSDLGVVVELAAEGLGVAVLPKSALDGASEVIELGLTHPKLDRRILLVWRASISPPAGRAFLDLARDHLTRLESA